MICNFPSHLSKNRLTWLHIAYASTSPWWSIGLSPPSNFIQPCYIHKAWYVELNVFKHVTIPSSYPQDLPKILSINITHFCWRCSDQDSVSPFLFSFNCSIKTWTYFCCFFNDAATSSDYVMLNGGWREGSGRDLLYYPSMSGETELREISVRILGLRTEIWTRDSPNRKYGIPNR
jgi:hypothetical protein